VIEDEHAIGYDIQGLEPGNCYFIRVRAGNEHGFGCSATSTPSGATPSSKFHSLQVQSATSEWRFGVALTAFGVSTKLLYVKQG